MAAFECAIAEFGPNGMIKNGIGRVVGIASHHCYLANDSALPATIWQGVTAYVQQRFLDLLVGELRIKVKS